MKNPTPAADIDSNGCWIWLHGLHEKGYAQMRSRGKRVFVHRWVYTKSFGPIPDGYDVHHTCGVRKCVNPEHLRLLSHVRHARLPRHWRDGTCRPGLHDITDPDNVYVGPDGERRCRSCMRAARDRASA